MSVLASAQECVWRNYTSDVVIWQGDPIKYKGPYKYFLWWNISKLGCIRACFVFICAFCTVSGFWNPFYIFLRIKNVQAWICECHNYNRQQTSPTCIKSFANKRYSGKWFLGAVPSRFVINLCVTCIVIWNSDGTASCIATPVTPPVLERSIV